MYRARVAGYDIVDITARVLYVVRREWVACLTYHPT